MAQSQEERAIARKNDPAAETFLERAKQRKICPRLTTGHGLFIWMENECN